MRAPLRQTCWTGRRNPRSSLGFTHAGQCADLYGQPATVDPHDNRMLHGSEAMKSSVWFSAR
jgi:hypothetical protein